MLKYFLSPAKADLLPTDGGSSAHSDLPGYGPAVHGSKVYYIPVSVLYTSSVSVKGGVRVFYAKLPCDHSRRGITQKR